MGTEAEPMTSRSGKQVRPVRRDLLLTGPRYRPKTKRLTAAIRHVNRLQKQRKFLTKGAFKTSFILKLKELRNAAFLRRLVQI